MKPHTILYVRFKDGFCLPMERQVMIDLGKHTTGGGSEAGSTRSLVAIHVRSIELDFVVHFY